VSVSLRAHVASLVAVFLALAVGVATGGELLHSTVVHDLRAQAAAARAHAEQARVDGGADRTARAEAEAFASAASPRLLALRLAGRHALVVTLPGSTPQDLNRLAAAVRAAGADLAGDLRVGAVAVDPDASVLLADVAGRLAVPPAALTPSASPLPSAGPLPSASPLPSAGPLPSASPSTADSTVGAGAQRVAAVLAAATAGGAGAQSDPVRVLATLRGARLLDPGSRSAARADVVLLLSPGGAARGSATGLLLALAGAYQARGLAVVVAGPASAAAAGGALAALRADPLHARVSSADGLDTTQGPTVAVLALAERAAGRTGHYGRGPGATAVLPPV